MKFKPTDKAGGVMVELGPQEAQLPPQPATEGQRVLPVFQLKRILVPVDFSDCCRKALHYAMPLAEQFEAELVLLHVVPANPPVPELGPVDVVSLEDAQKALDGWQGQLGEQVRSQVVLRALRQGEPYSQILKVAKEMNVDLIVLATHGRTGLARLFLGSTTEKVVRYAGCPVLVVREQEHEFIAEAEPPETEEKKTA